MKIEEQAPHFMESGEVFHADAPFHEEPAEPPTEGQEKGKGIFLQDILEAPKGRRIALSDGKGSFSIGMWHTARKWSYPDRRFVDYSYWKIWDSACAEKIPFEPIGWFDIPDDFIA